MTPEGIWQALPVPCFLFGPDNRISMLNPAAESFLNTANKSLAGRRFSDCIKTDFAIEPDLDRTRAGQSGLFRHDVPLGRGNSQPEHCDIQIAPLGDGSGNMLVLLQPRQIKGRLGQALQVKSAAKTAIGLAEILAHEIKNPLAGIAGAAQLLNMNLSREDQEITDLILQETRRIVDLLKQVEQFGDLRQPTLNLLNIHDILERARKSAMFGSASQMRFQDDYDPSLPMIMGDADQLIQVFGNLFSNAAEAAGARGGTITIRTFFELGLRLGDGTYGRAVPLQIEITDDGPGIPAGIIDSIFDPFVSGRENGTGLGLALVSKIVTEHQGAIVVSATPGRTSFRLSLPVAPNHESET